MITFVYLTCCWRRNATLPNAKSNILHWNINFTDSIHSYGGTWSIWSLWWNDYKYGQNVRIWHINVNHEYNVQRLPNLIWRIFSNRMEAPKYSFNLSMFKSDAFKSDVSFQRNNILSSVELMWIFWIKSIDLVYWFIKN